MDGKTTIDSDHVEALETGSDLVTEGDEQVEERIPN